MKKKMVIKAEKSLFVDVDETLVFMKYPKELESRTVIFKEFGVSRAVLPHWPHIETVKQFAARGIEVFVWSAGGPSWAEAVVRRFGLSKLVHVIPKPDWYLDDKACQKWMGQRFYLDALTGQDVKLGEEDAVLTRSGSKKREA